MCLIFHSFTRQYKDYVVLKYLGTAYNISNDNLEICYFTDNTVSSIVCYFLNPKLYIE